MKIARRFTQAGQDVFATVEYEKRTSRISNPDGSVVFEMNDAEIPTTWSQLATDIMVSKYFRKAGVPQTDPETGQSQRDKDGNVITGPERSAKQVINRLAGCWRWWGEKHGYFDTPEDAQAFYDELAHMLLHQMCAPNSPQWFNTGLNFAYGITGPAQGHFYCDPKTGEMLKSRDAYSHPQPHACQPYHALISTPVGEIAIGEIVSRNRIGMEVFDGTAAEPGAGSGSGTTRVVAVAHNGRKPVFRVSLDNGNWVEATADHLVFAHRTGEDRTWFRVDELQPGMRMLQRTQRTHVARATSPRDEFAHGLSARATGEAPSATVTAAPALATSMVAHEIVSIEALGEFEVYDIQTESGQYLSNDVLIHNCFIQSVSDDLVNSGGIMDLWTREARLFKYGSGTGSNFSRLRGEAEPLSGGGKSSGLMSFLKIGDRAAGAIKSGGTTRRAAKMVCLDLDHPDIENFVSWKVREELKVAAMVEGMKHLGKDQQDVARRLNLRLDYDFNGEAYYTVSGQNSNNSVRIPNRFFEAVENGGNWELHFRTNGKVAKSMKARELWDQIAYAAWRCADPGVQYDDTINQWHTCPKSGRINASNPCVTGDTRVLTPGGIWRRIDQMIHLPARIVTNLESQAIHATEGAFPTGTQDVYELQTEGGYSVKLTCDHKVWTKNRGWVEAQDLEAGDCVRLVSQPAAVKEIGEPQDHRFFQLLGMFVSSASGDPAALHLEACIGHDAAEEYVRYVQQTWGERSYDDDYFNATMVDLDDEIDRAAASGNDGSTLTADLTNRRLLSRLKAFVRTDGGLRRLGDDAFTSGLAAQKHLLRALFTVDGAIENGTLVLRSDSQLLLQDVQLLLLGFGVQSARFEHRNQNTASRNDLGLNDGGAVDNGGLPDRIVGLGGLDSPDPLSRDTTPRDGAVAAPTRHGLRIDPGSLRSFGKHVGLLPGAKLEQLAMAISLAIGATKHTGPTTGSHAHHERVATLTHLGRQQVFDLTEPVTSSFVANGITVHNCSEYMFLDDTACNLASLNVLTFFDAERRRFDIDRYKHGIRLWTIVLEISVLMASFPSEEIARLSYKFRTLGLGYANLGAMLMQAGIPYDSDRGRAICAALTAILTGESYATSAELARELGAFNGYDANKPDMLRVMRNHRRAAYDVTQSASASRGLGQYEALDIKPVGIDSKQFGDDTLATRQLLAAAQECWDRALFLGERHGYRNAQTTVIAPTGTIGLLMDCDTTGVEPDFALVKFKKLAGGGYFKIANQSLRPALENLGYTPEQMHDIMRYVMGTLSLHDAPHINVDSLKQRGFTDPEIDRVEQALSGVFELSFAFSPWSLPKELFERLDVSDEERLAPGFNLLQKLGFSKRQIDEANDVICGRGTVEGAPHLRTEHLAVFDCANRCGKHGKRFIAVDGHIRMMAAAQPFISGAISKTINLPNEATLDDIKRSYELSWKLGLKANALYRDGSKLSQPLNVKSDANLEDKTDEEDEEAVEAAREEVADEVVGAAAAVSNPQSAIRNPQSDNLEPVHTHIIEKIVERIVERPLRRRLPDTRNAITHKFDIAGHEGYITAGLYEDGSPGEVFVTMAKEGSTIGGLMDAIATLTSVALQYGVPVESLVRKFEHVRFEPAGMTRNGDIPMAKSLVDYIFRWLAMEFVPGYRAANAPRRAVKSDEATKRRSDEGQPTTQNTEPDEPRHKNGNGHGLGVSPDAKPIDYDTATATAKSGLDVKPAASSPAGGRLSVLASDPVSQLGSNMQADAPACDVCGSITVRSGTCYKCLNCGNSMGCS